jgi:hypothetical protein
LNRITSNDFSQSLQQINVLIDTLAVVKQREYLYPAPIIDINDEQERPAIMQEHKHFQWVVKRKVCIYRWDIIDLINLGARRSDGRT